MKKRLRFIGILLLSAAATAATAADITIAGHQGHSPAAVPRGGDSTQPTIPYWRYKQQKAAGPAARSSPSGSFRYGNSVRYRPAMIDRSTFQYRVPEFHRRRYDPLRGHTHRGRFDGRPIRYQPGIHYTKSFGRLHNNRPSNIRYGFQRPRD